MALVNAESAKVLTALNNLGVQNLLLTFKEKLEALSQNLEIVNGMDTNCNGKQYSPTAQMRAHVRSSYD